MPCSDQPPAIIQVQPGICIRKPCIQPQAQGANCTTLTVGNGQFLLICDDEEKEDPRRKAHP